MDENKSNPLPNFDGYSHRIHPNNILQHTRRLAHAPTANVHIQNRIGLTYNIFDKTNWKSHEDVLHN